MHISEKTFNSSVLSTHLANQKQATLDYLFPKSQEAANDSNLNDRQAHVVINPETTALFFSYFEEASLHDEKKQYGLSLLNLNKAYFLAVAHDLIDNLIDAIVKDTEKSNIALEELNDYIPSHPDDLYALDVRASLYNAKGESDLQIQDVNQIIDKNFPFLHRSLRYRGVHYYNKQEYTKALNDFNTFLDSLLKNHDYQIVSYLNDYPKYADILEIILLRALVYKKLGSLSNQELILKDLNDLSSVFSNKDLLSKLQTPCCDLQKVKIQTLLEFGEVQIEQKLYEKAIASFTNCLKITEDPDLKTHILKRIGFCLEMNNQLEDAIITYQDLIKLDASCFDYYRICANICLSMQEFDQALHFYNLFLSLWNKNNHYISYDNQSLKKYVEDNPLSIGIIDTFYMRAVIYYQRFDYESCLSNLNRFLDVLSILDLSKLASNEEFLLNKKFFALNFRVSIYTILQNSNLALADLKTIFNEYEKNMTLAKKIELKTISFKINTFLGRFIDAEKDRSDLFMYNKNNFLNNGYF